MIETAHASILSVLSAPGLFASLAPHELDQLAAICTPRRLAARAVLFKEGDPGDAMFIVAAGQVKVHVAAQDGDVVLNTFGPGEVFGEIAILDEQPRTATATTTAPTEVLSIGRDDFHAFLERFPGYRQALITILAQRLRKTASMVSEMLSVDSGVVLPPDQVVEPGYQVTIVGYGRYGKSYIGPKYAKKGYPWEVTAIVDPVIAPGSFALSVLGRAQPGTLIFRTFQDWYEGYFRHLSHDQQRKHVLEMPLKPDVIYDQVMFYIEAGVENFILPKPVVMNQEQLSQLIRTAAHRRLKVAVASQWYYSDFPRIIQRELRLLAYERGQAPVHKVEIEFSKENGRAYATPPPLLELPHVLQLLGAIGLVDFSHDSPEITGDKTSVALAYHPKQIADGVYVRASIDYLPSPLDKRKYPDWDYQERTLKVYFDSDSSAPQLQIDFWIKFMRSGDIAVRPGLLRVYDRQHHNPRYLELTFVEDQLFNMNRTIYQAFSQEFEQFEQDRRVLTLERYRAIGEQLMSIQAQWERCK